MPRSRLVTATLGADGKVYRLLPGGGRRPLKSKVDWAKVDATTEDDIARHIREDEEEAVSESTRRIKDIRKATGLSIADFADRIGVTAETVQSWEAARSWPRGPARKLLRALERAPRAVLKALEE
jgi:putative transcriptional regulator